MLKIISTKERLLTENEVNRLHQVMVKGYEVTEEEIWGKNYIRLFLHEFKTLIDEGNIYVAYLNDTIVGCIHIYKKNESAYGFGLLSVDFTYAGRGIGTKLIQKAEDIAKLNNAKQMKIEILRVKDIDVPHKVVLANYYKRLGYRYTHSDDCSCLIPEWKYKLLVQPSNFDFYVKEL